MAQLIRGQPWVALIVVILLPVMTHAQTPSPFQEWQYSGGIPLVRLYEPHVPNWSVVTGAGVAVQPVYSGAEARRVEAGPVIDVRYKDIAFLSTGEGLGVNILRGANYRLGVALGYDLGRRVSDDEVNLRGLGNISAAPSVKLYGSWVISRSVPVVIQADVRKIIGGADGMLGDLGLYVPLPGSSRHFVLLFGPSITWADRRYLQNVYGISSSQSYASSRPQFDVHGGINSVGAGLSATKLMGHHWMVNFDGAISHLRSGSAASPITEARVQRSVALLLNYSW